MIKAKTAWSVLVVLLLLAGFGMLLFTRLDYDSLQPYMDELAKDGRFESFTPSLHAKLASLQWVGWLITASALAMIIAKTLTQRWVGNITTCIRGVVSAFKEDAHSLWDSFSGAVKADSGYLLLLVVIFVAVILNSARFLFRPMIYDEAYTFNIFASRPFLRIISDYHLPNNHILHSLLVHFSYHMFGSQPWAVRLPAFIAGILLVPAGYLTARIFFCRDTAILSAGLIGFAPILVNYATNARGYSLLNLVTLLTLTLAGYVRQHENLAAWVLMMCLSTVGFYVLPTMLFPFGALGLWLLLSWLLGETQPPRQRVFLWHLLTLVMVTVLLVTLLYSPVMLVSGLDSLLNNPFVAPIDAEEYWGLLQLRLSQTWDVFNKGVYPIITWLLVGAFFVGIFFAYRKDQKRLSFPLVLLGFSAALVLLRRSAPFDRMWLYFVPIFLIWTAAGLVWIFRLIERRLPLTSWLSFSLKLVLLLSLYIPLVVGGADYLQRSTQHTVYADEVASVLGEYLTSDDQVAVTYPLDAPIIYYLRLYGFDDGDLFTSVQENPQTLYLLVNESAGQTPNDLMVEKNIPIDALDISTLTLLEQIHPVSIYQVEYRH